MKVDLTNELARMMSLENENLASSLRKRKLQLAKLKCTEWENVGIWISQFELKVLLLLLDASDDYLNENMKPLAELDHRERQAFKKKIIRHVNTCERCQLKVSHSLQWEDEVSSAIDSHTEHFKKILGND